MRKATNMDRGTSKTEPFRVLKQMSIRRHNLEKSSDRLRSELEHLQLINDQQGERISSSLQALRQEQEMTDQLLKSDQRSGVDHGIYSPGRGRANMSSRPLQREPSILRQLKTWTTSDIIQWLEQKHLNKFIFLFQRHHVTGADLANLDLAFLEKYEHISVSDREELLSHVYELLRLEQLDEEDPARISTPTEKEKYRLAKQIANDNTFHRSQSAPVTFISSQSSSSSSCSSVSSNASSPTPKQRKKSASSDTPSVLSHIKTKIATSTKGTDNRQQREVPKGFFEKKKIKKSATSSWYEALEGSVNACVSCYTLQKKGGTFGITLEPSPDGWWVISNVSPNLQTGIHTGDRILEINGCSCFSLKSSMVADILKTNNVIQIVTCKPTELRRNSLHEGPSLGNSSDIKWQKFRTFLTDLRDQDVSVDQMLKDVPKVELQKYKERETLKILFLFSFSERSIKQGETEYYRITMKSLNMEEASKPSEENYWCVCIPSVREQIMMTLKDIVMEASRQKFYLDRLISLVIEESPWLLDQVDANFDEMSMDNKVEEFC
ncbi:uncharacterized protein LOC134229096 [Saccostrea cucullata]|uniref:uncharacterized protein LOC134229096 n=1 Tax=Saccostrea cuccullata TaxID=36930 RepID=UPI002ED0DE85